MDITKIDKNFIQENAEFEQLTKVFTLPCSEIDLYGTEYDYNLGCFQRMDANVAKKINYNIEVLSSTTAGARARFKTNSKTLHLSVKYKYLAKMSNMSLSGSSGFSLLEENEDGCRYLSTMRPLNSDDKGYTAKVTLTGELKNYILYFPLYNDYIEEIKLGFDNDTIVTNGKKYNFDLPIMYYGSSITQGGCASRPDNCYQAYISKWNNVDYLNLGFSGGAMAEDLMIEYLSSIKSLVFVCDYDANAPSVEHLKNTHFKLYEAYRKNNPDTPIIFMTYPNYYKNVQLYDMRLRIIKRTYKTAIELGDKNVYFLDGRKLYGKKDRENCTVDGSHPNDLGFYRMAIALNKILKPLLNKK